MLYFIRILILYAARADFVLLYEIGISLLFKRVFEVVGLVGLVFFILA